MPTCAHSDSLLSPSCGCAIARLARHVWLACLHAGVRLLSPSSSPRFVTRVRNVWFAADGVVRVYVRVFVCAREGIFVCLLSAFVRVFRLRIPFVRGVRRVVCTRCSYLRVGLATPACGARTVSAGKLFCL